MTGEPPPRISGRASGRRFGPVRLVPAQSVEPEPERPDTPTAEELDAEDGKGAPEVADAPSVEAPARTASPAPASGPAPLMAAAAGVGERPPPEAPLPESPPLEAPLPEAPRAEAPPSDPPRAEAPRPQAPPAGIVVPKGYALIPEGYRLVPVGAAVTQPPPRTPQRAVPAGPRNRPPGAPVLKGPPARGVARSPGPVTPQSPLFVTGTAVSILAALLLTFALDLLVLGSFRHARDQDVAYSQVRADLANGTAPVNQLTDERRPVPLGTPLGVIDVPWLHLREVFFEGTTSKVLMSGPGHRRDTPMPGQVGNAVIFGRQSAFGGPFGALDLLKQGNQFSVVNGQGTSRWRVVAVRRAGDPQPPALANGSARLTLVTAAGPSFAPQGVLRVDADLITGQDAQGNVIAAWPTGPRPITSAHLLPSERVMAGDIAAWYRLVVPLLVLVPTAVGIGWARYAWGRWQAWLSGVPVLIAAGLAWADQVARLLPNLL